MSRKRNVTVEPIAAMTEAERIAREVDLCWEEYAKEKAKEAERVQAEIDQMYEEHDQITDDDESADDNSEVEEATSVTDMMTRKVPAFNRRKQTEETKKQNVAKALKAKAKVAADKATLDKKGKHVPEGIKKGYYSLLSKGAKFAVAK
jgi:hypothetical protein